MKKIGVILIGFILFSSCSKTDEEICEGKWKAGQKMYDLTSGDKDPICKTIDVYIDSAIYLNPKDFSDATTVDWLTIESIGHVGIQIYGDGAGFKNNTVITFDVKSSINLNNIRVYFEPHYVDGFPFHNTVLSASFTFSDYNESTNKISGILEYKYQYPQDNAVKNKFQFDALTHIETIELDNHTYY